MTGRRSRWLPTWTVATLVACFPALAWAEGAHGGHGGQLRFVDVVAGKDSVHFWGSFINWFLLVVLLGYFGAKPVRAFLGARRAAMEDAIREATLAKAQAQARYEEYSARLAQLDHELARLRADIERAAEEDRRRILEETEQASARMKRDTETLVRQHAEALERQVRGEVVDAAVAAAERVVRESIQADDQRRLADAYRDEVGRTRNARGQA
jgi:F-type H+-transporting ATPase subunit b